MLNHFKRQNAALRGCILPLFYFQKELKARPMSTQGERSEPWGTGAGAHEASPWGKTVQGERSDPWA